MEVIAGVDIGGSHVGVCLRCRGNASAPPLAVSEQSLTSRELEPVLELVAKQIDGMISSIRDDVKLVAIGVGCPGQPKDGVVVAASNFPSWHNVPIVQLLWQRFPQCKCVSLFKDSDAALAGELFGEFAEKYGSVRNAAMISEFFLNSFTMEHQYFFCSALGTGIGVSLLINGNLYPGTNGLVEGGHMVSIVLSLLLGESNHLRTRLLIARILRLSVDVGNMDALRLMLVQAGMLNMIALE
jgi:predicted NBD/HSP70 family sugar kinase